MRPPDQVHRSEEGIHFDGAVARDGDLQRSSENPKVAPDFVVEATLPPRLLWEPLIDTALREDLGTAGDLTTQAIVPPSARTLAKVRCRRAGVAAGIPVAARVFSMVDPELSIKRGLLDGCSLEAGETLFEVEGSARSILLAERTALNLLGRLCGIATGTRELVEATGGSRARVVGTRKTTPGLRALETYAIRCGGGGNHRFGLDDAVLIKDNHIAVAGGVVEAIRRARAHSGHMVKIEVEVDTVEQLELALESGVDVVLLDNMSPDLLAECVLLCRGRAITEASGGITASTIGAVAATGVDFISVGALTHSVTALDVGLDLD